MFRAIPNFAADGASRPKAKSTALHLQGNKRPGGGFAWKFRLARLAGGSRKPSLLVWIELIADVLVAAIRLAAALFTGSASMAAEGVHSIVDIGSGGLMLYGYRQSQRGPDRRHPLGHGRELYFWSFVVALLFFTLGAGFSIFEGVEG